MCSVVFPEGYHGARAPAAPVQEDVLMKKFLSAVLALSLLLSLACPALAEGRLAVQICPHAGVLAALSGVHKCKRHYFVPP